MIKLCFHDDSNEVKNVFLFDDIEEIESENFLSLCGDSLSASAFLDDEFLGSVYVDDCFDNKRASGFINLINISHTDIARKA